MTILLRECCDITERLKESSVDRKNGVIHGVKLLGWKSANNREYDPAGVDPQMYEGRPVYADHQRNGGERSVYDRLGLIENVTKKPDGIYGDLRCVKGHRLTESLFDAAERIPNLYGLSHTARGRDRRGPKGVVIEAVTSVQSVDLVGEPATVKSLYESRYQGLYESRFQSMALTLREVQEAIKATRPKYALALKEMAEAGIMGPESPMADPGAEATGADHEQAILDAAKACIDDNALDTNQKIKKIKELLKMVAKGNAPEVMTDDESGDEEADDAKEKEKKEESVKLQAELATLKARERLRDAADAAGVRIGKALLESITADLTDEKARAIVQELKGNTPQKTKAKSAAPSAVKTVQEGKDEPLPTDRTELKRLIFGTRN